VPENVIRHAIHKSLEERSIDDQWQKWQGDGWVSLAVRLGGEPTAACLYTYLPMTAAAPLAALAHAPFFTSLNRRDFEPDIPLNAVLLDALAELAGAC